MAQVIVGFDSTRGGTYNLQAQGGMQTAISAALPSATYSFTSALSSASLAGASGIVLMSAHDNIFAVSALSGAEQTALYNFVAGGGFAIIGTDSDYLPGGFPATNDSFLAPFGLDATGSNSMPITITNPSGNVITNGPFGLVTRLDGIASSTFVSVPGTFNVLGTTPEGNVGAGYFARNALAVGSGAVLFVTDTNVFNSGWATQANYNFLSNFVGFAAVPEPATVALMLSGLVGIAGAARLRRKHK
jgi:hypothetical protein